MPASFYPPSSTQWFIFFLHPPPLIPSLLLANSTPPPRYPLLSPPILFLSLSSGLTKDGDDSENADSLEEVLDILAQEGSDWFYGFFTFLHDVVTSPINRGVMEEEEQEEEGDEDRQAASQREGGAASDDMVEGVILDLLNQ